MKTIWNDTDRRELEERLNRLTPDTRPQWGKFTAPQLVVHLADSLHMALGELPVASKNLPIRYPPLKQLFLYVLPFPKGVPTSPELIARAPGPWDAGVAEIRTLLMQMATRDPNVEWPDHPAFGRMRRKDWGVLVYRHMAHHFRQFGV
jgi:hypothetical protein